MLLCRSNIIIVWSIYLIFMCTHKCIQMVFVQVLSGLNVFNFENSRESDRGYDRVWILLSLRLLEFKTIDRFKRKDDDVKEYGKPKYKHNFNYFVSVSLYSIPSFNSIIFSLKMFFFLPAFHFNFHRLNDQNFKNSSSLHLNWIMYDSDIKCGYLIVLYFNFWLCSFYFISFQFNFSFSLSFVYLFRFICG